MPSELVERGKSLSTYFRFLSLLLLQEGVSLSHERELFKEQYIWTEFSGVPHEKPKVLIFRASQRIPNSNKLRADP